jgi:hypothetical protein
VLDDRTDNVVFSGKAMLAKRTSDQATRPNADIHELDFTRFRKPGIYRISVERRLLVPLRWPGRLAAGIP